MNHGGGIRGGEVEGMGKERQIVNFRLSAATRSKLPPVTTLSCIQYSNDLVLGPVLDSRILTEYQLYFQGVMPNLFLSAYKHENLFCLTRPERAGLHLPPIRNGQWGWYP